MTARSRLPFSRLPYPSLPRIAARRLMSTALLAISAYLCSAAINPAAAEPADLEEDYGEFTARPEEPPSVAINDIVNSVRLKKIATAPRPSVHKKRRPSWHAAVCKRMADKQTPA